MSDNSSDQLWKAAKLVGIAAISAGITHLIQDYLKPKTKERKKTVNFSNRREGASLPSVAKL